MQPVVNNYYVLFPNHHEGLLMHKKLKEAGIKCTIAPPPREASSFCGISLLVDPENLDAIRQIAVQEDIKIEKIACIPRKTGWDFKI